MSTTKAFVVDGKDRADVTADAIALVHDTMIMSTDAGLSAKGRMIRDMLNLFDGWQDDVLSRSNITVQDVMEAVTSGAITMMGNIVIAAADSEQMAKSMMAVFAEEVGRGMGNSLPELLKAVRKKIGAEQEGAP